MDSVLNLTYIQFKTKYKMLFLFSRIFSFFTPKYLLLTKSKIRSKHKSSGYSGIRTFSASWPLQSSVLLASTRRFLPYQTGHIGKGWTQVGIVGWAQVGMGCWVHVGIMGWIQVGIAGWVRVGTACWVQVGLVGWTQV
jgi:hypothetical protein